MTGKLLMLLFLILPAMKTVAGRGGGAVRGSGNNPQQDSKLDNYQWWSSGDIPTYIWVIAAVITMISVMFGIWTECCPNCLCAAQIKSYFVPAVSGTANRSNNVNLNQHGNKMLPISDDEFLVTFKD